MTIDFMSIYHLNDVYIMVMTNGTWYEYYVRDDRDERPFLFMFGVKELVTVGHLGDLYDSGYFQSFLEV